MHNCSLIKTIVDTTFLILMCPMYSSQVARQFWVKSVNNCLQHCLTIIMTLTGCPIDKSSHFMALYVVLSVCDFENNNGVSFKSFGRNWLGAFSC